MLATLRVSARKVVNPYNFDQHRRQFNVALN